MLANNSRLILRKLPVLFITGFLLLLTSYSFAGNERSLPFIEEVPLPDSLTLCGEKVPLENPRVREMLDRELTIAVWDRAQVFMWLKRAGRYFPHMEKELARSGLPEDLKYLAVAESSLIINIRSRKGAMGTWQFMTQTARHNGLRRDRVMDERRSFERSTEAALKHLKRLKNIFGTWTVAMAAYNCGEACLKREIKRQKVNDYYRLNLPLETERYIFRIAAIKLILENPGRYGYRISPDRIYQPVECDRVQIRVRTPVPITNLARALGTDYKVIKELNPQILGYYLPTGKYTIKVPPGTGPKVKVAIKKITPVYPVKRGKVSAGSYVVQPGDTLSGIAKKTGVSVHSLRDLNGISGSLIRAGQVIRIK